MGYKDQNQTNGHKSFTAHEEGDGKVHQLYLRHHQHLCYLEYHPTWNILHTMESNQLTSPLWCLSTILWICLHDLRQEA